MSYRGYAPNALQWPDRAAFRGRGLPVTGRAEARGFTEVDPREDTETLVLPIHPFPARMAPEVALAVLGADCNPPLPAGSVVLDPMAGSGTVVRVASELGHRALGFDVDPLAVLMAKVWTTPIDAQQLRQAAERLVEAIKGKPYRDVSLPWIDADRETGAYVDYWFAEPQRADLRRLSTELRDLTGPLGDALRLGLSRIIITKDHGASLARDVSHSRPHRVRTTNDFAVADEFLRAVRRLAQRLEEQPPPGNAAVGLGDARCLTEVTTASVDAVITSPPYLNAIDYLRGHRLALVWLGHRVGDLRVVRARSIGTECGLAAGGNDELIRELTVPLAPLDQLPPAERGMVDRYILDVLALVNELSRVIKVGGKLVLVVGNSCIRGVFVKNAQLLKAVARRAGFAFVTESERVLPPNRRYLPPPRELAPSDLEKRMRSESVLTFRRSAA